MVVVNNDRDPIHWGKGTKSTGTDRVHSVQ